MIVSESIVSRRPPTDFVQLFAHPLTHWRGRLTILHKSDQCSSATRFISLKNFARFFHSSWTFNNHLIASVSWVTWKKESEFSCERQKKKHLHLKVWHWLSGALLSHPPTSRVDVVNIRRISITAQQFQLETHSKLLHSVRSELFAISVIDDSLRYMLTRSALVIDVNSSKKAFKVRDDGCENCEISSQRAYRS